MGKEYSGLQFTRDVYGTQAPTRWRTRDRCFPTCRLSRPQYLEGQLIALLSAHVALEEKKIVDPSYYGREDYGLFRKAIDSGLVLTFRGILRTNNRKFVERCSQHHAAAAEFIREIRERASST
ncbi:MAG: hypothetical protein Q8P89_01250 [bacterium]|nr:hypothetical protein [bacterium]